jgi:hypothetical protein
MNIKHPSFPVQVRNELSKGDNLENLIKERYKNDLTSRIYFYRLETSNYIQTRKMVMIK